MTRSTVAVIGFNGVDDQLDDGAGREEFPAIVRLQVGKLREEVFVDALVNIGAGSDGNPLQDSNVRFDQPSPGAVIGAACYWPVGS